MRQFIFSILVFTVLRATGIAAQISGVVRVTGQGDRSPVVTVIYAEPLDRPSPPKPGRFKLA
ncbi:MAG: hypothetical protein HY508_07325, partial [Acidobacteria bacterium]|nr:hypothetical protein [Acidobacteriota bacterium]